MSIYEDALEASKALNDHTEKYATMINNIRRICCKTLNIGYKARESYEKDHGGHCFVTPDAELKGQESMAYMILDELGLKIDYWFCGNPILEDKDKNGSE